jgi:hypothetical protein
LSSALPKSNSTSVDSVSFWITGAAARRLQRTTGAGAGAGASATGGGGASSARATRSHGLGGVGGHQNWLRTHWPNPLSTTWPLEEVA